VAALATVPLRFRYRVVCGLTGSGKSRLLAALDATGAQVLDLEALARHRGSLLGDLPDAAQPTQKAFESAVLEALSRLDPSRVVFVESESKRIGRVQVPEALLDAMRASPCVRVELPLPLRIALLKEEYGHFLSDPDALAQRLAPLVPLHGRETIARWDALARAKEFDRLVERLLVEHYDPTYARAIERNFPNHASATGVAPRGIAASDFTDAAARLVASTEETPA
jgi:tRNA 2-selenouridine synthase